MNLSYRNSTVRDYCYSKKSDLSNDRFSVSEIMSIRTYIADLRSAPSLADVPINYCLINDVQDQLKLIVQFDRVKIICSVISSLEKPIPSQIKRIQILDIIGIDLHIADSKVNLA